MRSTAIFSSVLMPSRCFFLPGCGGGADAGRADGMERGGSAGLAQAAGLWQHADRPLHPASTTRRAPTLPAASSSCSACLADLTLRADCANSCCAAARPLDASRMRCSLEAMASMRAAHSARAASSAAAQGRRGRGRGRVMEGGSEGGTRSPSIAGLPPSQGPAAHPRPSCPAPAPSCPPAPAPCAQARPRARPPRWAWAGAWRRAPARGWGDGQGRSRECWQGLKERCRQSVGKPAEASGAAAAAQQAAPGGGSRRAAAAAAHLLDGGVTGGRGCGLRDARAALVGLQRPLARAGRLQFGRRGLCRTARAAAEAELGCVLRHRCRARLRAAGREFWLLSLPGPSSPTRTHPTLKRPMRTCEQVQHCRRRAWTAAHQST